MTAQIAICLAVGGLLVVAGLAILAVARSSGAEPKVRFPSLPTRLLSAVILMVAGYHLAAWGSPHDWFPIKLPRERGLLAAVLAAVAFTSSVWMDRREAQRAKNEHSER